MSMLLLLPIGLAALASLLLPLLVHLARRSEPRVVPFAALRWLRAQPQPQRKHRLEELLLLLLRFLLLVALSLLLAQPVLFGKPDRRPWVVVAPQVDIASARKRVHVEDARWHRLAPGFPALDAKRSSAEHAPARGDAASFASLLRELDAELPAGTRLTVVVPQTIDGADAQRPVLSREVDWRVVKDAPAAPATPASKAAANSMPTLAVRYSPDRARSLRYLRAAGVAWSAGGKSEADERAASRTNPVTDAPFAQPLAPQTRNLAWLVPGPVPATIRDWVANGGKVLLDAGAQWPGFEADAPVVWRDDAGPLVRGLNVGRGRVMRLERALVPASMPVLLEPVFPGRLQSLFASQPPAPARVDARDYIPLTGAAAWPERPRPLSPWLVWTVAVLFLLERLVASGRRRSVAP